MLRNIEVNITLYSQCFYVDVICMSNYEKGVLVYIIGYIKCYEISQEKAVSHFKTELLRVQKCVLRGFIFLSLTHIHLLHLQYCPSSCIVSLRCCLLHLKGLFLQLVRESFQNIIYFALEHVVQLNGKYV